MKNLLFKVNNWNEFKSSIQGLNTKQKGDAFELLTKCYLQLDSTYKSIISNVWIHHEVPNPIRKKLNLPPQDMGIDIIAETKAGEYWAVQCKYREDESNALTWKEVSTFIGLANTKCKHISYCIVATSKDRLVKVLDDVPLGLLAGDIWRNLDDEFFQTLHKRLRNKTIKIKPFKPFKHQKRAVKEAHRHFVIDKQSRGKMIMPCGAGKSLTAFWIAEKLEAKTIVIAVPSLSLIRQTLRCWLREVVANKIEAEWICVCSDQKAGSFKQDELQYLNQDLGVPALTDPAYISSWLRKRRKGLSVVFTTYQSGKVLSGALRKAGRVFDLGIMDEAHKTVGNKDKSFSHLLYDENIKIRKRVFMTATERRYQGKSDDIASMDDPEIYGDTFELLSFKEALEQDPPILSDYKIITIGVSKEHVEELIRKNFFVKPDKGKWDEKVEAQMLASLIALRKAMRGRNIKHALSFHSSIAKAKVFADNQKHFTKLFPEYWNVDAFHVHGKMNTSERDRIIKDEFIKSKRAIMTNARCLTEGVDVPDIDCVLFADPKKSTIDIVQAVGRALRIAKGKKFAHVIVPVIIDEEKDFEKTDAYQSILMVLRALASNDDRIIEYFRAKTNRERKGTPVEIEVDEKLAKLIDTKEFTKTIELNIWSRLAKLSWRPFEEAREYSQSLGLKNMIEWYKLIKKRTECNFPVDIPTNPSITYKDKGWMDWGNWLGTGFIYQSKRSFLPIIEARAFIRKQGIKGMEEWRNYCKKNKPDNIPSAPWEYYKNDGYVDIKDWLGIKDIKYRDFESAKDFVRRLNLSSMRDWKLFMKGELLIKDIFVPNDIPKHPNRYYTKWTNWGDFLGTYRIYPMQKDHYDSFHKVLKYARTLNLKSKQYWYEYWMENRDFIFNNIGKIPKHPHTIYKNNGWISWHHFARKQYYEFLSYDSARLFAAKIGLDSQREWKLFCQNKIKTNYKLPTNIPKNPSHIYNKRGWQGWPHWLGSKRTSPKRNFLEFKTALIFVRKLNLKSTSEWYLYCKNQLPNHKIKPDNIPSAPSSFYKNKGWEGIGHWLGTGVIASSKMQYLPYDKASSFVKKLHLHNHDEWKLYCQSNYKNLPQKPSNIPNTPWNVYRNKGWINIADWLGCPTPRQLIDYMTFEEAKKYIADHNFTSIKDWGNFKKAKAFPSNMPKNPYNKYNNKGWKGWPDFLGNKLK